MAAKPRASTKKKAVKKSPARKSAKKATKKTPSGKGSKKPSAKKATKKTPSRKATKKTSAKKATKKTPARKATKKTPARKVTKKAPARKVPVKKTTRGSPEQKTPARKTPAKKSPVSKDSASRKPEPVAVPPLSKRISKRDLRGIRDTLLSRRRALIGSIDSIESEYLGTHENVTTKGGDEADQASTALTADISLRLAEKETLELREIEVAMSKLEDGSYGICEATGQQIDVRRLKYRPWARLSLDAQNKLELHQLFYDETTGWVMAEEGT